jgi:hypothetical protein
VAGGDTVYRRLRWGWLVLWVVQFLLDPEQCGAHGAVQRAYPKRSRPSSAGQFISEAQDWPCAVVSGVASTSKEAALRRAIEPKACLCLCLEAAGELQPSSISVKHDLRAARRRSWAGESGSWI